MKRMGSIFATIFTLGLIIIIHESGHFIACKLSSVPVLRFSIGFGPVLISKVIGGTEFALSALPFGGYVAMNADILATKPFLVKMIILCAGICFNLLCAICIIIALMFVTNTQKTSYGDTLQEGLKSSWHLATASARALVGITTNGQKDRLSGPRDAIATASSVLQKDIYAYLFMVASINMQVAFFNLLPIPFFDGGQIAQTVAQAIARGKVPSHIMALINVLFLVGCILLVTHLTQKDLDRFKNNDA